ncbi:hypothetical protein T12_13227 [Trichinella patagoniensis]|uniref:Uncharacterized protein n=1 Tax=Trichinella patagoniensis TaxID=990121 RepID=A0A0V0W3L1_9BILA|nr:hypothetical protein T12_13227 [Trichinella patagoniensis]
MKGLVRSGSAKAGAVRGTGGRPVLQTQVSKVCRTQQCPRILSPVLE